MTWRTVKQLADAATPEKLFTGQWQNRPSVLDDYKFHLDERWNEGCTNTWKLWEEIVPLGYKGGYQRVRAYLHEKRTARRRWPGPSGGRCRGAPLPAIAAENGAGRWSWPHQPART
ncbi:hypothetical protein PV367_19050 [Streptomyces europaeiscabiei]|uniref:Uncharacterized protein n=1 Tax=Streptomyces europaeiscabiei TaxID=146819 RepID=A0AAJ2PQI6_9ACTN|nr:hypothetical protein [Streptomyces europaeiscabiei]MDX3131840.1 hypothetical protein [Streptomyces europaeiscabiei]